MALSALILCGIICPRVRRNIAGNSYSSMSSKVGLYPELPLERDRWILSRRGARQQLNPRQPFAFTVEEELSHEREIVKVATIFLTNRECPWRCLMCDIWRNTLTESVQSGAIPEQIDFALSRIQPERYIKLYYSGCFFDVH